MPRSLDLSRLEQFSAEPRRTESAVPNEGRTEGRGAEPAAAPMQPPRSEPPELQRWPSREPVRDGQISIKAPLDVIARFRKLCKDDRRTYADMLSILMNAFEKRD